MEEAGVAGVTGVSSPRPVKSLGDPPSPSVQTQKRQNSKKHDTEGDWGLQFEAADGKYATLAVLLAWQQRGVRCDELDWQLDYCHS